MLGVAQWELCSFIQIMDSPYYCFALFGELDRRWVTACAVSANVSHAVLRILKSHIISCNISSQTINAHEISRHTFHVLVLQCVNVKYMVLGKNIIYDGVNS